MKNFIVLGIVLLQYLMANSAQSSTFNLEDEHEYSLINYENIHYGTITPTVTPVIIVADYDETEEQPTQNTASWYQRPYKWAKRAYTLWSLVQGNATTTVAPGVNDENIVINYDDNFKTKRLKFAVKFWHYADHGTEVAICACTSAATAFYVLPDHNKCTGEWSYTDFGSIFTGAATLLGVVKIGVKYIGSYRARQLEENQS